MHRVEVTVLGTFLALAVTAKGEEKLSARIKAVEPTVNLTGMLDIRPGYLSKTGEFYTENAAELGVKVGKNLSLTYLQAFNNNLYNPGEKTTGAAPSMQVGYVRGRINGFWENTENRLKLSYEQRLYLPVMEAQQDLGLIAASRNYFKLSHKVNDSLSLSVFEIPVLFAHTKSGTGFGATASANNIFENRVYLIADIQFTQKISLSIPVMFHQTRKGDYADAKNSGTWSHFVWTNPELDYSITDKTIVGVSYYNNDSFFASDYSDTNFGGALESGVFQLVFTQLL